ncbi:YkgJ family cysteine cluster protein [Frateuria defendens]|uniref:YkgJ family cysteine cluster protein n=1 Tax=Frateuria defendens TaxID=2219559 RepID=UPI0009E423FB|nr:YkgJ family cysteine cluster protein [Frateuria defendens]
MDHPCLHCGVCCAYFRVAFHWSETDPALGGTVPAALTEKLDPHRVVMRGTQASKPRCAALEGPLGSARCGIYPRRPSVCRAVPVSWEFGEPSPQCDKARLAYGMAPLTPADWIGVVREAATTGSSPTPGVPGAMVAASEAAAVPLAPAG